MASDPFDLHHIGDHSEDRGTLGAGDLFPELLPVQRCNSVNGVQNGPWIGTLVCCIRPNGHRGEHSVSLGDADTASYWHETWR
jgi:hypothetical protein